MHKVIFPFTAQKISYKVGDEVESATAAQIEKWKKFGFIEDSQDEGIKQKTSTSKKAVDYKSEYKKLTGEEVDGRWNDKRIKEEYQKAQASKRTKPGDDIQTA